MIILLHSSKTMRSLPQNTDPTRPLFLDQAIQLNIFLKTRSNKQLAQIMKISPALAAKTNQLITNWSDQLDHQTPAIDSFIGDIYSGLRANEFSTQDRVFAQQHLRILSGLYGILSPLDGIMPYRLEMAYKLTGFKIPNLYQFWGRSLADSLPTDQIIINTSSVEYSQLVTTFIDPAQIVTPTFLTINPQTKAPTNVVVHAKIARGAFARWLITSRASDTTAFNQFTDLNYQFDSKLSTVQNPVYICQTFGGTGLSQRLIK